MLIKKKILVFFFPKFDMTTVMFLCKVRREKKAGVWMDNFQQAK